MFTQQRKDKEARRYLERRTKLIEWIKDTFTQNNDPLPPQTTDDLIELVADGTILCKLINLYYPNSIQKIIQPRGVFFYKRIENINEFLLQCHTLKVPIIFQTLDLFENKNPARVVNYNTLIKRKMKRRKEFTLEELARAHQELEVDEEAKGKPLSAYLSDSLPEEISSQPTLQFQLSSSNTYESSNLSVLDASHQRMTVVNTPRVSIGVGSGILNLNRKSIIYDLANEQLKQSQQEDQNNINSILDLNHLQTKNQKMTTNIPIPTPITTTDLATTASIKTAAISTTPIRKNVNSFNSSSSLFNSNYNNNNYTYSKYSSTNQNINNNIDENSNSRPMTLQDIEYHTDYIHTSLQSKTNNNNNNNNNSLVGTNSSTFISVIISLAILIVFIVLVLMWMILFSENHDRMNNILVIIDNANDLTPIK
ncbi:hypothetical protein DFA_05288 [Cavenderia fasciculata]|uniref:Calponin-homology (CH) domain-containing protein n=1 Tax=Cavenderia fasciculata TaxID=261658 RepID=F4PNV3_CACFS|nr:uncharacterized protein DFA_05288 [Cavenderia fasciculata]EGG23156.1 hypothetical protein DFA_05288 [Cavenderia fasciculata]|eukprot:XP_004361007.1 hypothetical protein DFA_05288 [Cavenderia fasciculata]